MSEQENKQVSEETVEVQASQKSDKAKAKTTASKKPSRIKKWFTDLKSEMSKVVWPSKSEVVHNTAIVLATVLVAAVIISGLDFVFQFIGDALIALGS